MKPTSALDKWCFNAHSDSMQLKTKLKEIHKYVIVTLIEPDILGEAGEKVGNFFQNFSKLGGGKYGEEPQIITFCKSVKVANILDNQTW